MAETLNGTVITVLKEVKSDYGFRRFRVSLMEPGRRAVLGTDKRPGRSATKPKYLILSENEIIGRRETEKETEDRQKRSEAFVEPAKKKSSFKNADFRGIMVGGVWTVTHENIPTIFVGRGKSFGAAKENWITQHTKSA